MAEGSWKRVHVRCPFYLRDDAKNRRISCEGVVDRSVISITYRRRDDYLQQIDTYCCKHYKKCEVYRMLMDNKYKEDE